MGHFKNTYELLNLRALKFSHANKILIFQCVGKIFVWNFKGTLWNSTQNILPIHWKMWLLYKIKILGALRFKSSYAFLKRPPNPYPQVLYSSIWFRVASLALYWDNYLALSHQWDLRGLPSWTYIFLGFSDYPYNTRWITRPAVQAVSESAAMV